MYFSQTPLQTLVRTGLADANVELQAKAENLDWEQRIVGQRLEDYEKLLSSASSWSDWESRHKKAYLGQFIRAGQKLEGVSDCFLPINQAAQLGVIEGNQWLLRLETLDSWVFSDNPTGIDSFATLKAKWERIKGGGKVRETDKEVSRDVGGVGKKGMRDFAALKAEWKGMKGGADARGVDETLLEDQQKIDQFLQIWAERSDCRPVYAGLKAELQAVIDTDDWADFYRDALGLGHINPGVGESVAVALMCYRVEEVQAQAAHMDVRQPFSYPTVLDNEFNTLFVPSPLGKPYGAALDLRPLPLEQRCSFSEVLHLPIPYQFQHILKLGEVRKAVSWAQADLTTLRRSHRQGMSAA